MCYTGVCICKRTKNVRTYNGNTCTCSHRGPCIDRCMMLYPNPPGRGYYIDPVNVAADFSTNIFPKNFQGPSFSGPPCFGQLHSSNKDKDHGPSQTISDLSQGTGRTEAVERPLFVCLYWFLVFSGFLHRIFQLNIFYRTNGLI